jgi:hypothetical protein
LIVWRPSWLGGRHREEECLRVGRHSVQRWRSTNEGLVLQAEEAIAREATPQPRLLTDAIARLYPSVPQAAITLVLESAWLPVMLVDTGSGLLSQPQLEALVHHRFGLHYFDSAEPVADWELRIEHRAGDRYALAFGLAPALKLALTDCARALKIEFAALSPVFAWGRERLRTARAWPRATGWCVWAEQDRSLVARIEAGALVGLNAGAATADGETAVLRSVEAEAARFGIDSDRGPVVAAGWTAVPRAARAGDRLVWCDVRMPLANVGAQRLLTTPARTAA